jgi:hypothetical protein
MKKTIIAAFIAILSFFTVQVSAQSVVSVSTSYISPTQEAISVVYSSNWTGNNGSTNPDLAVEIQYQYYERGKGIVTLTVTPILSFNSYAAPGEPLYVGSFDHSTGSVSNVTVLSSTPIN